jgi:hypothetical protein
VTTTTEDEQLTSAALGDEGDGSQEDDEDDDSGGSFLTDPGTLAAAAGVAAAAGLGLSGLGSKILGGLLRFLAGTSFGLFLLGLFRRDKRPGPPIDFTISTDGPITHLAWAAPTTGGPPEKYVLEARRDEKWREVLDFDADNTRAAVPTSEVEGAETWRLRASNDHGIGKPSDEVGVLEVESGSGPGDGSTDEKPESDGDGTA